LLVSSVCLQSGQSPQLSHPRFLNLSAVQSLFCKASQPWFFALGVAQAFQTILYKLESTTKFEIGKKEKTNRRVNNGQGRYMDDASHLLLDSDYSYA
jgi:hypothetical protein